MLSLHETSLSSISQRRTSAWNPTEYINKEVKANMITGVDSRQYNSDLQMSYVKKLDEVYESPLCC